SARSWFASPTRFPRCRNRSAHCFLTPSQQLGNLRKPRSTSETLRSFCIGKDMTNVIPLNRARAEREADKGSREDRLERLRRTLIGLIDDHADLPRHDLISEFSGCLVVIEAGAYGWRK